MNIYYTYSDYLFYFLNPLVNFKTITIFCSILKS